MEKALQQKRAANGIAGARILIVEDQPEVAALLKAAVTGSGGQVLAVVTTVEEAIKFIAVEDIAAAIVTMIANGVYRKMDEMGIARAAPDGAEA